MNTLQKMRHVIPTTLSRLIKDSAVPLMSQVFFTSKLLKRTSINVLEGIFSAFNVIMCFVSKENYLSVLVLTWLLYRYIIGKKGETRKRLEFDTKTSISIPKQGVEGQIGVNREHHHKGGK